jgi:hypothetical protein
LNGLIEGIILMDKQQVLGLLDAHRDRLYEFSVKVLFLFGSDETFWETAYSDLRC